MRLGFGGSERSQFVDLKPAMVNVMSTILHHKHPRSVSDLLALKSLMLTTMGVPGSVQRLENQLGAAFSRQTSNAMLSNMITDSKGVVLEWKSRVEQLWQPGVTNISRKSMSIAEAPGFVIGADNVGKVEFFCSFQNLVLFRVSTAGTTRA